MINVSSDSSDDESDIIPLTKRRRDGVERIAGDVKAIRGDIASLFEVSRTSSVPLGLKRMLIEIHNLPRHAHDATHYIFEMLQKSHWLCGPMVWWL